MAKVIIVTATEALEYETSDIFAGGLVCLLEKEPNKETENEK